jgi:hypothetical protein
MKRKKNAHNVQGNQIPVVEPVVEENIAAHPDIPVI